MIHDNVTGSGEAANLGCAKSASHHNGAAVGCENHRVPPGCLLDMGSPRPY